MTDTERLADLRELVRELRARVARLERTATVGAEDCQAWGVTNEVLWAFASRSKLFEDVDESGVLWGKTANDAMVSLYPPPSGGTRQPHRQIAIVAKVMGWTPWEVLREVGTEPYVIEQLADAMCHDVPQSCRACHDVADLPIMNAERLADLREGLDWNGPGSSVRVPEDLVRELLADRDHHLALATRLAEALAMSDQDMGSRDERIALRERIAHLEKTADVSDEDCAAWGVTGQMIVDYANARPSEGRWSCSSGPRYASSAWVLFDVSQAYESEPSLVATAGEGSYDAWLKDGAVMLTTLVDDPAISILSVGDDDHELSASECRELGEALIAAALVLDQEG